MARTCHYKRGSASETKLVSLSSQKCRITHTDMLLRDEKRSKRNTQNVTVVVGIGLGIGREPGDGGMEDRVGRGHSFLLYSLHFHLKFLSGGNIFL